MAARRLISEHAWYWLAAGHLLRLAELQRALSLVPCSLAALMQVRLPCVAGVARAAAPHAVCASAACMLRLASL
jgi:hypothetical protein